MSRLVNAISIARQQGLRWVWFRLVYAVQLRLGIILHRLPLCDWADRPLHTWLVPGVPSSPEAYAEWRCAHSPEFFFTGISAAFSDVLRTNFAVSEAEDILAGRWPYFGHTEYEVGFPPDWHSNPLTGVRLRGDRHWSLLSEFGHGDIKLVWEANRFGIVYTLARAYAATADERYPSAFWTLIEDWAQQNPPQAGANWKCGQEAAIRLMAWCFAWFAFKDSPQSTPQRQAQLATMLAFHADRIEGNIDYALSQNNNHGLSEAAGLWTVGLLWPEFSRADHWRCIGKKLLEEQIARQIFADGSYVQHSTNYHRLMLQVLLWSFRLGELRGDRFSHQAYDRLGSAVDFLSVITDRVNGGVPNHGSNDGSLILPLNNCDFSDLRPVLQATNYLLRRSRLFDSGPWDEDLLWLFGANALKASALGVPSDQTTFSDGGYYILRGQSSWGMLRCARYRTRPAHADQLHLDLWWRGVNVAIDAGTFLYNGDPPWRNSLARTSVHNTISVDGLDQMTRASLFLWTKWSEGTAYFRREENGHRFWEGEHDGYRRRSGIVHRRAVFCDGDVWVVVDDLVGSGQHAARLHWLLPDLPHCLEGSRIELETPAGSYSLQTFCSKDNFVSLVRAGHMLAGEIDSDPVRGWISRYYGDKESALSLAVDSHAVLPLRFVTVLSPTHAQPHVLGSSQLVLHTDRDETEIRLAAVGSSTMIEAVG
jgi:Heparinase II/III-like protein/Heparinase II/III N-terminus